MRRLYLIVVCCIYNWKCSHRYFALRIKKDYTCIGLLVGCFNFQSRAICAVKMRFQTLISFFNGFQWILLIQLSDNCLR